MAEISLGWILSLASVIVNRVASRPDPGMYQSRYHRGHLRGRRRRASQRQRGTVGRKIICHFTRTSGRPLSLSLFLVALFVHPLYNVVVARVETSWRHETFVRRIVRRARCKMYFLISSRETRSNEERRLRRSIIARRIVGTLQSVQLEITPALEAGSHLS